MNLRRTGYLLIAALILCYCMTGTSSATQSKTWQELNKQADSLFLISKLDSALTVARKATAAAEQQNGPADTSVFRCLTMQSKLQRYVGKYEEAVSSSNRALEGLRQVSPACPSLAAEALDNKGNSYCQLYKLDSAESCFLNGLNLFEIPHRCCREYVARFLDNMSKIQWMTGAYDSAQSLLNMANRELQKSGPSVELELAVNENRRGYCHSTVIPLGETFDGGR